MTIRACAAARAWSMTLCFALALGVAPSFALANGVPVSLVLSYLSGISNWGPANATGVAEIVPREGEARVTVTGLPKLTGEEYVVWVVNGTAGPRMALGSFNTDDRGVGKLDVVRDPFPDQEWDTLMISVEAAGSAAATPSNRHTVAGKKPIPGAGAGSTTSAGTQASRPSELPNTGGATRAPSWLVPAFSAEGASLPWPVLAMAVLVGATLSGVAGFRIARLTQRR